MDELTRLELDRAAERERSRETSADGSVDTVGSEAACIECVRERKSMSRRWKKSQVKKAKV
jgi:hypothetical protein